MCVLAVALAASSEQGPHTPGMLLPPEASPCTHVPFVSQSVSTRLDDVCVLQSHFMNIFMPTYK